MKEKEKEVKEVKEVKDEFGTEGFEEQEFTLQNIPVLSLAQSQTPEVVEGEIEGLKAGCLLNKAGKRSLGDSLELIVFKFWTGRTKFPPRESHAPIECFSPDNKTGLVYGNCKTCAFANFDLKERCLEQNFFVVGLASNPHELYRLIFAKSNKRTGTALINLLRSECSRIKAPIYGVKINLTTKRLKNEKQNAYYYVFNVAPSGVVDKSDYAELHNIFNEMTELRTKSLQDFEQAKEMRKNQPQETPESQESAEFSTDESENFSDSGIL